MASASGEPKPSPLASDAEPVFRVVEGQDARRGIRLERAYWQALRDIATATAQKTGSLVSAVIEQAPDVTNATSLLRVYCLKWALGELEAARRISNPSLVGNLVRASPGPAFALGLDKRIIAYNQSFLAFVQARFSYAAPGPIGRDFRLALDVHLTDLAANLKANGNTPTPVGFVVGLGDRRLRGNLNSILAPVSGQDIILCYVLP
ncbi:hypothetical protein ASD50_15515 [Mesorhizobium sp. Root552]|uniref:ribbon-helix-helix domain-containing protein n=1 Tax=Mesorhizobium sp. Root552 TaxID=1736555 RepID=UPI0006F9E3C6|nr:ribbon-helix-helix domain-containing protein [Mesorhizobium sp. Root552]KQZ31662.1 hypothetical protein ASD50_15515 [Mesorhizobium sp. Root552]